MEQRFKTFTVLIAGINRSIRRIKTEEMAELQLKSPHVSCLYYLYLSDSLTARELCDISEEDKASISRSIEYLEANGYLVCNSKTRKRYRSPLELTEKGHEAGRQISARIDAILEKASEGLTEDGRSVLYQSLALINSNLQKICGEYGDTETDRQGGEES